jgi:cytochrome c oxidase cbb3-type subunit III
MQHTRSLHRNGTIVLVLMLLAAAQPIRAQQTQAPQNPGLGASPSMGAPPQGSESTAAAIQGKFLQVPVNTFVPGGALTNPNIQPPNPGDPAAAQRGMRAFNAFNCVGCHMGNGGGGMGPALSNRFFIYGSDPANIYLSIAQGRPRGMPAWGGLLPDTVIWDLVAYIRNLSNAPVTEWGQTISSDALKVEQVPAENAQSDNPWQNTQPFSGGSKPPG